MSKVNVSRNIKTSAIAKDSRPIESIIIAKEEQAQPSEEQKELLKAILEDKHKRTTALIYSLFHCRTNAGIDGVIAEANAETEDFLDKWGNDLPKNDNTNFALRIRNAEVQARRLVNAGIDLRKVNPVVESVVLSTAHGETLVATWGRLASKLLEGYKVEVK